MIATQSITAWAEVGGTDNFRLTHAEIDRAKGRKIGTATVKGIASDISNLRTGANVKVRVAAETSSEPWEDSLDSSSIVFFGEVHKAMQNQKGLITVEAHDFRDLLHSKTVKLNTENPQYTHRVLKEILEENLNISTTSSLSNANLNNMYLASPDDFPGENTQRPWQFGKANRGDPLTTVIEDLLKPLGGVYFADRKGRVRFQGYPEHTPWETPFITEINAGEETRQAGRVIFQGSGIASERGQGASYAYNIVSTESPVRISPDGDKPDAPEKTLQDQNVTTLEEADATAYGEAVEQDQDRDMGTITIIGNADIELYDHVIVPEVEYDMAHIDRALPNDLQAGRYNVDGLVHTIDATDGFLTQIKLSPPIDETYKACTLETGRALTQKHLSKYENKKQESKISGVDDITSVIGPKTYGRSTDDEDE